VATALRRRATPDPRCRTAAPKLGAAAGTRRARARSTARLPRMLRVPSMRLASRMRAAWTCTRGMPRACLGASVVAAATTGAVGRAEAVRATRRATVRASAGRALRSAAPASAATTDAAVRAALAPPPTPACSTGPASSIRGACAARRPAAPQRPAVIATGNPYASLSRPACCARTSGRIACRSPSAQAKLASAATWDMLGTSRGATVVRFYSWAARRPVAIPTPSSAYAVQ
jgi:hypothetical protein